MIEVKLFEIRDRATFIAAMAVSFSGADGRLLRRAGYAPDERYVLLTKLDGVEAQYDPHKWANFRTLGNAHYHIREQWDSLPSGAVIDVEYVLGETSSPKESELR